MSTRAGADVVLPYKLARQAGGWRGTIAIDEFLRFGELISGADGPVTVDLAFRLDEEGRCRMQGHATVRVRIECGRCLLPQSRALDVPLDLCVVASDTSAAELGSGLEPYVLDGDEARVADLVEDDLILALPHQVCDEPLTCPNRPALEYGEVDAAEQTSGEPKNPFAALADWVGKRKR
jgi:DUF177 domain-containing protein